MRWIAEDLYRLKVRHGEVERWANGEMAKLKGSISALVMSSAPPPPDNVLCRPTNRNHAIACELDIENRIAAEDSRRTAPASCIAAQPRRIATQASCIAAPARCIAAEASYLAATDQQANTDIGYHA